MRLRGRSLPLLSGLMIRVAVSCGVGHRRGLDPALLWLWCRPATIALIRPLAWEPPYAAGAALEDAKRQKKGGESSLKKYLFVFACFLISVEGLTMSFIFLRNLSNYSNFFT